MGLALPRSRQHDPACAPLSPLLLFFRLGTAANIATGYMLMLAVMSFNIGGWDVCCEGKLACAHALPTCPTRHPSGMPFVSPAQSPSRP